MHRFGPLRADHGLDETFQRSLVWVNVPARNEGCAIRIMTDASMTRRGSHGRPQHQSSYPTPVLVLLVPGPLFADPAGLTFLRSFSHGGSPLTRISTMVNENVRTRLLGQERSVVVIRRWDV